MTTTLAQIHSNRQYLIRERDATLEKITQHEFPNVNIVNVLRRAVEEYYRPRLELLDFKFDFVQNMMTEKETP